MSMLIILIAVLVWTLAALLVMALLAGATDPHDEPFTTDSRTSES